MPIPEKVLDAWTNYESAAINSAKTTHRRIRNGLEESSELADIDFETFLQGSYANTTLVRGSGDVDVVVKLNQTWLSNLTQLGLDEKRQYSENTSSATYPWSKFKLDVIEVLRSKYIDKSLDIGDKAIEVDTDSLPIGVDVVVCIQFRRYSSVNQYPGKFLDGIVFWNEATEERIENFPNQHKQNGEAKQKTTSGRFKASVRLFKNARNSIVERGWMDKVDAPSYFIECLLYNVPSEKYQNNLMKRYRYIVDYLEQTPLDDFRCQNEVQEMFGSGSTQWTVEEAKIFIKNLQRLHDDY